MSDYLSQSKIFNHFDRVLEWLEKGVCFPLSIQIDLTNICTRNCPDCSGNKTVKNAELSLVFMKNVIKQVKPFCRGMIFTGGGEPLCNKNTLPAIKFAKENGIDVALNTNADLIVDENARELVKYCSYIRVSYYDDKVWDKIALLVKCRNQQKSKCTIGVGFLTNKEKVLLMQSAVEKAKKAGADYIQFRPYHLDDFDASEKIKNLQNEFTDKKFKVISTNHKYFNIENNKQKNKKYAISLVDNFRAVITADGMLYPDCFTRGLKSFCLGDLNKDSFEEIWFSNRRKKILNSKLKMQGCPPMCFNDPLDEILNNIMEQYKNGKHVNFI